MGQEPAGPEGGQEPTQQQQQEPKNGGGQEPQTFSREYVEQLRAEAAKHRTEAKERADKLKEIEDRDKSDLEKANETAAEAAQRAETATAKLARYEACVAAGLDIKHAGRLQGSTPDELKKDAEEFKKTLGDQQSTTFDGGARERSAPAGGMDGAIRKAATGR